MIRVNSCIYIIYGENINMYIFVRSDRRRIYIANRQSHILLLILFFSLVFFFEREMLFLLLLPLPCS